MASKHIKIKDANEIPGKIINNIWVFPCIKTPSNTGKTLLWQIYVYAVKGQQNDKYPPVGDVISEDQSKIATQEEKIPTDSRLELKPLLENKQIPAEYVGVIRVDSKNGIEGKIRDSSPTYVTTGKNIGKSDETNAVFQALRDAYGLYHTKLRKTQGSEESSDLIAPMLAESVESLDKLKYPVFVQRKYDGLRVIATIRRAKRDVGNSASPESEKGNSSESKKDSAGELTESDIFMYSRNFCAYPGHNDIRNELAALLNHRTQQQNTQATKHKLYFDGEFYKHGVPLQEISGEARGESASKVDLDYVIYDLFDANNPSMTFDERNQLLRDLLEPVINKPNSRIKFAETFVANNPAELTSLYERFLKEDYEGAIVRNMKSPYKQSRNGLRSSDLLKLKPVYDHEFEVVGWTTGKKGKGSNAFMIICKLDDKNNTDDDKKDANVGEKDGKKDKEANVSEKDGKNSKDNTFPVTPALELDVRNRLTEEMRDPVKFREKFLGKKIIVQYEDVSNAGIPLRARTKLEMRAEGY